VTLAATLSLIVLIGISLGIIQVIGIP